MFHSVVCCHPINFLYSLVVYVEQTYQYTITLKLLSFYVGYTDEVSGETGVI